MILVGSLTAITATFNASILVLGARRRKDSQAGYVEKELFEEFPHWQAGFRSEAMTDDYSQQNDKPSYTTWTDTEEKETL